MGQEEVKKDDKVKSDVGIDDNLGEVIVEEQKKSLEKEVKQFTERIEDNRKNKKRVVEQWAVDKEVFEIQQEGFHTGAEPKMAFELNPRYWELMKQKHAWSFEQEQARYEGWLKQTDKELEALQEQLDSATNKLKELNDGDSSE